MNADGGRRFRATHDEEGAALIVALAFIMLFGLTIAATLSLGDTSFRVSDSIQNQRYDVYAADGAVQATIASMRGNVLAGKEIGGVPCGQTVAGLNTRTVSVSCTPQTNSGAGGGGTGVGTAIQTLGKSANEPGIFRPSSDSLTVGGDVVSNSTIDGAANSKTKVTGSIYARQSCGPLAGLTATAINCNLGSSTNTIFNDPGYAMPATVPADKTATVPSCTPGTVIGLDPGTYTDANKLNALTTACPSALIWLKPGGNFYFDFKNSTGSHQWLVNDKSVAVVVGTLKGLPTSGLRPLVVPFPGACDTTKNGSELIFGSDSQLFVLAGQMEMCSPNTGDEIAVYGSKGTQQAKSGVFTASTNDPTIFSNPSAAWTIGDNTSATVSLPNNGASTASIKLKGYNGFTIPTDATLTGVSMQLVDALTGDLHSASVTITKADNSTCSISYTSLNVSSCFTSPADLNGGFSVTYQVTLPNGAKKAGTASLDGIAVSATWLTNGFEVESGCITADGYNTPGGDGTHCAVVKTDGNFGNLAVHGVLYAPLAPVDINLTNAASQLFDRGIVSRNAYLSVTPASGFTGSVISVPGGGSPLQPREVLLVATINSTTRVRALVKFDDGIDGSTPGKTVTVEHWEVMR